MVGVSLEHGGELVDEFWELELFGDVAVFLGAIFEEFVHCFILWVLGGVFMLSLSIFGE